MIELRFLKELVLVSKASESKEFDICHYCFLDKDFKLQPNVCNGFHDVLMMSSILLTLFEILTVLIIVVLLIELAQVTL